MAAHQRIGVYSCWSCTKEVPVKRTATGKLSMACPWCDFPHYANEGTEHHANVLKATTLDQAPAAAAAEDKSTKPKPAAAPAAAPAASSSRRPLFAGG